jgi:hypothetical protein
MQLLIDNLKLFLAVAIALIVLSSWFGTSAPLPPSVPAPLPDTWQLPALPEGNHAKSIETITARNLWGETKAETATVPEWKIMGVAMAGKTRLLLIAQEGQPIETLKIGDKLPDGAKITAIEKDRYLVLTPDNKKLTIGISKNGQVK